MYMCAYTTQTTRGPFSTAPMSFPTHRTTRGEVCDTNSSLRLKPIRYLKKVD